MDQFRREVVVPKLFESLGATTSEAWSPLVQSVEQLGDPDLMIGEDWRSMIKTILKQSDRFQA